MNGWDARDLSDTTSFVLTLVDIIPDLNLEGARMIISSMKLENGLALMPQAVTQACASFIVNRRDTTINHPVSYILGAARIQHDRLTGARP